MNTPEVMSPYVVYRIAVSAGADEPVTATITDATGRDITGASYSWALLPYQQKPTTDTQWTDVTATHPQPHQASVEVVIAAAGRPLGRYTLWIRVTDGQREYIRPAHGLIVLY